ncbi:general secretion pathway protein GspB [Moritella yayanosii]|uniref:General secretion pathway protein B n=1 Tax=Moritella yayanosii TaxID=69539 RepID=A0A330LQM0_9GAMM|nr:general secretion pathway protein GspB [Moritella yayanosii]SQD78939.1 General secretion pathway protein B [Moritella yayanosii]
MNFVVGKTLIIFSISVSFASVLWSPVLLAMGNVNNSIDVVRAVSVGVEQTDPLIILKLPDIEFAYPLSVIRIPVTSVSASYSENNLPVLIVSGSKPAVPAGQPSELLTMNAELANEQVSPELLAKFNRALTATSDNDNISVNAVAESYNAVPLAELPQYLRAQIPDINYSSHIYSSNAKSRSVRLNNRDLREGSWLSDDVEILEILQNEVIMRVGVQSFSLQALSDWSA